MISFESIANDEEDMQIVRKCMLAVLFLLFAMAIFAVVRYTDNGDGTVTDHGRNLLWQKCSRGQNETNCTGTATSVDWQGALQYCRNLTLAERNWRLPNINELKSLVDYSVYSPPINISFFPNTVKEAYWSSTTYYGGATRAWYIYFINGHSEHNLKTQSRYVRCVADGP
jgi:hypothetical protein